MENYFRKYRFKVPASLVILFIAKYRKVGNTARSSLKSDGIMADEISEKCSSFKTPAQKDENFG